MRRRTSPLTAAVMIPLACLVGMPLYYVVVNTFKTQPEMAASPLALPSAPTLENYRNVVEDVPLVQSFANTVYVTALSILVMLAVGATAAYGMVMRSSAFNRVFGAALLVAFLVPGQATLIPIYRLLVDLDLVDTLSGLVVFYSSGSIFCFFLVQGYLRTIPMEIIEAARIDGAGAFQIFWRIVLPLIRPILATVGVFQTMWVWNDFITPNIVLSSPDKATIVLQVYRAVGQFTTDWPAFMTLSVVVLVPMVVFFVLTQRHIVSGILAGSIKG